jgi:hypothetical protein
MNQTCRPTACSTTNVAFVQYQDFQPTHGGVARNARTVDARTDDDEIEGCGC